MARKKKKQGLSILALLMLIGAVLSIVGLFTPFFASTTELFGKSTTETFGLFNESLSDLESLNAEVGGELFPISLIRVVAIAGAVLSVICLGVAIFGKASGLIKFIIAGITIAVGILVFSFGGAFASDLTVLVTKWTLSIGAYLSGIGIIMTGGAFLFKRK
jgi:hypothetical protein